MRESVTTEDMNFHKFKFSIQACQELKDTGSFHLCFICYSILRTCKSINLITLPTYSEVQQNKSQNFAPPSKDEPLLG